MPEIVIDLGPFIDWVVQLGQQPPPVIMWELFRSGGWIPVLIVFLKGFWWIWLNERQSIFMSGVKPVLLAIDVPKTTEQTPKAVENIFAHLLGAHSSITKKEEYWEGKIHPIFSFEIVSIEGYVQFLVHVWDKYRDLIEAVIYAQYPDAEITEVEDYTKHSPEHKWPWPAKEWASWSCEFVLKKENAYPIKVYREFEDSVSGEYKDPMAGLLEAMAKMRAGEQLWIQMIVQTSPQDWNEPGKKLVRKLIGAKEKKKETALDKVMGEVLGGLQSIFGALMGAEPAEKKKEDSGARSEMLFLSPGEKTVVESIERKLSKIGLKTKIRVIYIAPKKTIRVGTIVGLIRGAFQQFATLDMNQFKFFPETLTKYDYSWQMNPFFHYLSLTFYKTVDVRVRENFIAYKYRSNWRGAPHYILSTEELASIWHFPAITIRTPTTKKAESKRSEPPIRLPVADRGAPPTSAHPPSESPDGAPPANLPV